jgi:cell division protein FtsX
VPLYGADIGAFWTLVSEYGMIFEKIESTKVIHERFDRFEASIDRIQNVTWVVGVFLILTGLLIVALIIMIIRYHMKLFRQEYILGRLMGAEPYFLFLPHALTVIVYNAAAFVLAWGLFTFLQKML